MYVVAVAANKTYTFSNVTVNHTISVSFTAITYTITSSAGSGGTISPSGTVSVNQGSDQSYTISPSVGYQISDVLVDNVSVGAVTTYTFSNVTVTHTISASSPAITYTITSSAGSGGTISPSGTGSVNQAGHQG